jgi:hypothetical protein
MSQAKNVNTTSRRDVLAGIATAPALSAPALALMSGPDPIFAAIERHKARNAAFSNALQGEPETASPEHDEWLRGEAAAGDAEREASAEMVATVPTTLVGLLASLLYVEQEHIRGERFLDEDGLEEIISTTVSALAAIGAAS